MDDEIDKGLVQIALRIPPALRERIKAAAEANNRSVNKELTNALEDRYPEPKGEYDALVETLVVLRELADNVNEKRSEYEDPAQSLLKIRKAIDRICDQLPFEVANEALSGWSAPEEFYNLAEAWPRQPPLKAWR